jgi:anaphase-promoting complex subunit 2
LVTLDEHEITKLCKLLEMDDISGVLEFWVSRGILRQFGKKIVAVQSCPVSRLEELMKHGPTRRTVAAKETAIPNASHLWPMISSFLTNRGASPVANLHRTLQMLCSSSLPYTLSKEDLDKYLTSLVHEEKLEYDGTKYKIKK